VSKNRKKLLFVFGTRPEAIKMSPLIRIFKEREEKFDITVCVTGQHREMLDQVLELFEIKPDYDLNVMKVNQDLFQLTSDIMIGMKDVLHKEKPDLVFVHGDTTTTFLATLSAFYMKIDVAHVEAGLRTYNIYSPWPEEINRQLTGRIAKFHFAPTKRAQQNLLKEGVPKENIIVTGNTVIDALFYVVSKIKGDKKLEEKLQRDIKSKILSRNFDFNKGKFILVTGHRRENFGQGMINICEAIKEISDFDNNLHIIYPVHLNPNVKKPVNSILAGKENVHLIEPLDYLHFVYLMEKSYLILTDSGGVQEEAPSLGKPVLVMRETTERPEAVEAGTVKLVGTNKEKIVYETKKLLQNEKEYEKMSKAHNPYGDGLACQRILNFVEGVI
jgi:UDP-N-acetylglucosamine 2-epimerase (non-hydrolysing)